MMNQPTHPIADIKIGPRFRHSDPDPERVKILAQSIQRIGLRTPIMVCRAEGKVRLVAGRHRLAAAKALGWTDVPVIFIGETATAVELQLIEIAENLHRAELTHLERDEHIAHWLRLTQQEKSDAFQFGTHQRRAGQQPGGVNAAARALGITKSGAHRAVKVASITPEAKAAAREAGLADNQGALLKIAKAPPEEQVDAVAKVSAPPPPLARPVAEQAAQEFAEWLLERAPQNEIPMILTWLEADVKTRQVSLALRALSA